MTRTKDDIWEAPLFLARAYIWLGSKSSPYLTAHRVDVGVICVRVFARLETDFVFVHVDFCLVWISAFIRRGISTLVAATCIAQAELYRVAHSVQGFDSSTGLS